MEAAYGDVSLCTITIAAAIGWLLPLGKPGLSDGGTCALASVQMLSTG